MSATARVVREMKAAIQPLVIMFSRLIFYTLDVARQKSELKTYETGVLEIVRGNKFDSNAYAIFVYYEPQETVSDSVARVIRALKSLRVNTVLVCNHELTEKQESFLTSNCHVIILRNNQGFDFGAYKDALKFLYDQETNVERLLIMNDSLFFSARGLMPMLKRMLGEEDVISTFENWGEEHHLQSFAISVSKYIYESEDFKKFWVNYFPINNRIYAIEKGEKKLSSTILKNARSSHVVFSVSSLYQKVVDSDIDFSKGALWVPHPWRGATDNWGELNMEKYYSVKLSEIINSTSPIHAGAYLFPKYLECPIYKKDIVYRHRFNFWEVESWTAELLDDDERSEYLGFLRIKGDSSSLPINEKIKYNIGAK